MTSLRLLFITNQGKWLSYEDIKQVEKQATNSMIRHFISQLRESGMIIISQKNKGYMYVDLDIEQTQEILLKVEKQARNELATAYKRLKLYNKWLDYLVYHVQDFHEDEFNEYLEDVKEASGFKGDIDDLIDSKEDAREQVKLFLGDRKC